MGRFCFFRIYLCVNGYYNNTIGVNIDSSKALNTTVGHEVTHVLEGTELYTELQNALFEYSKSKGDFDSRREALAKLYDEADIDFELTSDLVGDYLFTDEDFINNLSTKHRNVFEKIYDEIKYLCKIATAGSKEARQLEKVKRAFEKAYQADTTVSSEGAVKYSVTEMYVQELSAEDAERYYKTGKTGHVRNKKLRIREAGGSAVLSSEKDILKFVRDSVESSTSDIKGYATVPKALSDKILAATNGRTNAENWFLELSSDDLFHAFREHQKAKEPGDLDMSLDEFERLPMQIDGEAEILGIERYKDITNIKLGVKGADGGDYVVVEMVSSSSQALRMKNAWKVSAEKYRGMQNKKVSAEHKWTSETPAPSNGKDLFSDIIPQNSEKSSGSAKFSLSDSDGKTLTNEQNEYFKDSKMRDDNGNLKVMYHGSQDEGFHIFDSSMSDDDTCFFFVDRNDVAASYSGTTETYEAQTIRSAEDMNKFIFLRHIIFSYRI